MLPNLLVDLITFQDEIKTLLTSLYYSKLYYGSEVWHLPGRSQSQSKKLKLASANAIRSCNKSLTIFNTHTQIRNSANRPMPDQMLTMHKLFNSCQPDQEFLYMNFQFNQNPRVQHANFFNRQNTIANLFIDKKKNRKLAYLRPSLPFYAMTNSTHLNKGLAAGCHSKNNLNVLLLRLL